MAIQNNIEKGRAIKKNLLDADLGCMVIWWLWFKDYLINVKLPKWLSCWFSIDYLITIRWLSDDYLMTTWWLPDDYLMTIWWLYDGYLMTIWWLSDDYLMTSYYLMTTWWLPDDFLTTTWWVSCPQPKNDFKCNFLLP